MTKPPTIPNPYGELIEGYVAVPEIWLRQLVEGTYGEPSVLKRYMEQGKDYLKKK